MKDTLLLSRGGQLAPVPRATWEGHLVQAPAHAETRLSFMSPAHHRLRYFVVQELPRFGAPLPPELLARRLDIPLPEIIRLLDDLERHLFFPGTQRAGRGNLGLPRNRRADPSPAHL